MPISLKSIVGSTCIGNALRLKGLQNNWTLNSSAAYPGESTVTTNITTSLSQMLSVDVPAGKKMILLALYATGLSTTQALTFEFEIDGEIKGVGSATPGTSQIYFSGSASPSALSAPVLVESNFKLRLSTATPAQNSKTFRYSYYLV